MKHRLFLPQSELETWLSDGTAELDGESLVFTGGMQFLLASALYFDALLDGQDDASLLGTVRDFESLGELGVEHASDAAVVGDAAYQVVEGFVGTPQRDGDAIGIAERLKAVFFTAG